MLPLALRPRVVQPSVHLEHELVEVDASFLVALEALKKQIAAQGLAAADLAVDVQALRDPRLSWFVDFVALALVEDSVQSFGAGRAAPLPQLSLPSNSSGIDDALLLRLSLFHAGRGPDGDVPGIVLAGHGEALVWRRARWRS